MDTTRERETLKLTTGPTPDTSGINKIIEGYYRFENLDGMATFLEKDNLQN